MVMKDEARHDVGRFIEKFIELNIWGFILYMRKDIHAS